MTRLIKDSPRKPRLLNSPFDRLSERQEASVVNWFLCDPKLTYDSARRRLKARFGIKVSIQSVCSFWHRAVSPILARKGTGLAGKVISLDVSVMDGQEVVYKGTATLPITPRGKAGI